MPFPPLVTSGQCVKDDDDERTHDDDDGRTELNWSHSTMFPDMSVRSDDISEMEL